MIKPLFVDNDYQILNSASGQIARNFWENQLDTVFNPLIVCASKDFRFESRWKIIQVKEYYGVWYLDSVFRRIGLPGLSLMPDMYRFSWAHFVKKRIRNVEFDYIHTLSSPQSTHLIGLDLKKKTGKPWIAQFNDPWTDSSGRKNHKPAFTAKVDSKYERMVVENADLIIHTNHILPDIWIERYGDSIKDKMVVIPLNFNISSLPNVDDSLQKEESGVLNIAHIGEIYSTRSCVDFLKGVSMLFKQNPEFRNMLHITFVGGVKKEEAGVARELGLDDVVEYTPRLAPEQLGKYYNSTDVFLAIDVNLNRSPSYPSKLMMYHYYRKPILGVTNPNSIMEEELNNSGNFVCYYGHPEQVAEYLHRAITDYNSLNTFDKDYWKRFTVENVTSIYTNLVNKLVNRK